MNISSKLVSGDYYDLIEREDGKLAMIIADVSGKGMPASLLASNIQAAMRAQCDTCDSPAEVLERINRQIHASTDPQHFATLFLAIFDPAERRFLYSSGGHNPPVLLRADGSIELLEAGGLPLGAFDFGTYEEDEIVLGEGEHRTYHDGNAGDNCEINPEVKVLKQCQTENIENNPDDTKGTRLKNYPRKQGTCRRWSCRVSIRHPSF